MALASCRECGQQVSTEATTCPKCGVPHPTKATAPTPAASSMASRQLGPPQPSAGSGLVKLAAVVIGLVVIVGVIGRYSPGAFDAAPPEQSVDLRVAAVVRGPLLHVASGEPGRVSDCRIRLNHEGLSLPYEYYLGDLGPNEERNIFLNEFLKGSDRFDPTRQAVTFLTISCLTPNGRGHTGWKRR